MTLAFGKFLYEPTRRELRRQGTIIQVDPKQLDLLAAFLRSPGVLLTKQELLRDVWAGRGADSALSVAVAKLRKVLGHVSGTHEVIENRYGRGYRFLPAVTDVNDPGPVLPPAPLSAASFPLVGRVDCVRRLDAAIASALDGRGGLCALLGEPGIGKTRLAEAAERHAQQLGMRSAWGRFFTAEGAPPLAALAQLLRELNRDGVADDALRLLGERSARPLPEPTQSGATSELAEEFLYDAAISLHRTVDEMTQALLRLSHHQPTLLVLDDLQWADSASLRLLSHLVSDLSRAPLLVIATARTTSLGSGAGNNPELLRLLSQYKCERIELQRLRESDVAEYIGATFDGDGAKLGNAVFARSGGNPFFMVELLRPWLGQELPEPEQLRLSGPARDVVRQRLSDLPDAARSVLSAASVIGRDFDLGLLSQVTERSADELLEALDGSLANDTIIASSHVPGAYAFEHELIRESLYADLAASERCRLHLRIAEGLQRRALLGGDSVTDAELAHHLLSALPHGQVGVAIAHARRAAAAARRMASHSDARSLLRRAFESLKFWQAPDPRISAGLLLELAMVERVMADPVYVEHLKQGLAIAREHRFGPLLAGAGRLLSPSPGLLARPEAASVLEAAAEILPASDLAARAIVLCHLAWTPPHNMSGRKVNALLAEAMELAARSQDAEALVTVRRAQLFFWAGPESQGAAEKVADEIEQEGHADPVRAGRVYGAVTLRMILAMQRGDKAGLERRMRDRMRLLAELNNKELDWHNERLLIVNRLNRGEFSGLAVDLEHLRKRAERLRLQAWPAVYAWDYSRFLLWTGDASAFGARIRKSLQLVPAESPFTLARKLLYMVQFGFLDDASAALASITSDSLRDLPRDRDFLAVAFQLSIASAAVGSRAHCEVLYEMLLPHAHFFAAGVSFHNDGSVSHCLGKLAQALGQRAAAISHFEAAAARNAAFELRPHALESQFELAQVLEETDPARSRELRAAVHEGALSLGLISLANASA